MPKRKSSKTACSKAASETKISKLNSFRPEDKSNETITERDSKSWLQSLPNEVLELIYSFLSPRSLLAIASLNCGRVSDLIRKTRCADFSSCNDILPAEMQQFMSADITNHLRELNFTSIFFVKSSELVKIILRCKYLTTLTVIECCVYFHHMRQILKQCKHLKELYWSVLAALDDNVPADVCVLEIKKLYFYIDCPKSSDIAFYLLRKCPDILEACFNFTSLLSPRLPLRTCQKNIVYKLHSYPVCPVNIILDDYYENMRSVHECIMSTKWCNCSHPVGSLYMPMTTPYLQVVASGTEHPSLATIPEKNIEKLVLYYSSRLFLQKNMEKIKRVAGKNLAELAVKEIKTLSDRVFTADDAEYKISMTELISNLMADCSYIQVLILSSNHFTTSLDLRVLHCLKGLKTLGLSSCALNCDDRPSTVFSTLKKSFEDLVQRTKQVEHFSIVKCEHRYCRSGPKDKDLLAISKWIRLKTLSVINVENLQYCTFLRDIAVNCRNFKSLEIMDIPRVVHHYIPNVMNLLSHCPQLIQLCMSIDILCIKNWRFWESISLSKNLQSLCLTLTAPANVHPKAIADTIEELPYLHLFHLNSPCINEGLGLRVTRIMRRHGVTYPKVELTTVHSLPVNYTICDSPHIHIA